MRPLFHSFGSYTQLPKLWITAFNSWQLPAGNDRRAKLVVSARDSLLLGHKNGDITTHYSAAEVGELIAATNRISAAKGTPSITLLRVTTVRLNDMSRARD